MLKKENLDGYKCAMKYTDVDWIQTKDEIIIHIPFKDRGETPRVKDLELDKYKSIAAKAVEQNKELEKAANRTINMYKEGFENGVKELEQIKEEKANLEARVHDLEKKVENYHLREINNYTDIIIHKQAFPKELAKDKSFMELYELPTYGELTKLAKGIREFAETQLLKAEQKLEDIANDMVQYAYNETDNIDATELAKELVKYKTIRDIMEDILSIKGLKKVK